MVIRSQHIFDGHNINAKGLGLGKGSQGMRRLKVGQVVAGM